MISNATISKAFGSENLSPRKALLLLTMGVILVAGALVSAQHLRLRNSWETARAAEFLRGESAADFTDSYSKDLPFRDFAIDFWGVLGFVLFQEGRQGVIVGREGWLYSSEEFEYGPQSVAARARQLSYMRRVRSILAARGTHLVVALLPSKARVYPENLRGRKPPAALAPRYGDVLEAIRHLEIAAPDLMTVLQREKAEGQVFMKTDTHWTPVGARATALAISQEVHGLDLPRSAFTPVEGEAEERRGDLMRYIRLGALEGPLGPPREFVRRLEALKSESTDLFGDAEIPVVLVGTSYSANTLWGFEDGLKLALQADVLNAADEGAGPIAPMSAYLNSVEFESQPPRLVIWEVPERFLDKDYPETVFEKVPIP